MQISVSVDDREPSTLVSAVRAHEDVAAVNVSRLASGDIVVGDVRETPVRRDRTPEPDDSVRVAFERKTVRDYASSVFRRSGTTLGEQVEKMNAAYAHSYVLLEGNLADVDEFEERASAIRGSMASITARDATPVIPCGTQRLLVDVAVRIGRKHLESPSTRSLRAGAVPNRNEPVTKRMYGCIEGVGPTTAAALYDAYPTVEAVLSASVSDLQRIGGVGETRARAIHEAFRSRE
ncbi:helix-hairpin-helix domain-containing protein [Haloprofundus salilacus]|uniref:helix-hairpin-helix domain-containing protein n=1 Tax=Haloprofundus salilacus TaxID=2876190 RepID=UPI001CCC849F|nr:helix-hairpin-helix domain-containing protein [Haloprofundus salilacus]